MGVTCFKYIDKFMDKNLSKLNAFQQILHKCRPVFWIIFGFAFCINILMLITPLYSLQVLDRVIGSGNLHTLLMLSLINGLVYLIYSVLQIVRSFTLIKVGEWLDNNASPTLFSHSVASSAIKQTVGARQLLQDFQAVKQFLTSSGINTILDAPWSIAYIIAIFMIHRYIGYATLVGAVIIVIFALLNAMVTNQVLSEATELSIKGMHQAEIATRNAEVIEAMGMMKNIVANWKQFNSAALKKQSIASYRNGIISNTSRFLRNILQMMVTALGAYVVVTTGGREMTTGGMIASSILVGRALMPFDNLIEIWKQISNTMKSYKRINDSFKTVSLREESMAIPGVVGHVVVDRVYYTHAQPSDLLAFISQPRYVLQDISFNINPGEILAIIGSSAAGKSTLAKIIVGVWKATSGTVRLDGGEIYRWNREDFGHHIGYLPQSIDLFSGSVKQNIARMSTNINAEQVVEAAKAAGAHQMILSLPDGYDSDIGVAGSNLSGGQRQRIALARAFYGNPQLMILDEPNANLDEEGEQQLGRALLEAKARNTAIAVISHRPSILSIVDRIIILRAGAIVAHGTKEELHNRVQTLDTGSLHLS